MHRGRAAPRDYRIWEKIMPLPLPDLDDRRFDDLVDEARARLASHLPELTRSPPGDPVHAMVDLFAWMTETVIYRANLIPERQRLAFLNLLQLPLRPAVPASGLVCIDSPRRSDLPALLAPESLLMAGDVGFTTAGELQPTPLVLSVLVKEALDDTALAAAGVTRAQLREQYGVEAAPFQPRTLVPGTDVLTLSGTLDHAFYLAFSVPERLATKADSVRANLKGIGLNVGLAPADELDAELTTRPARRTLEWDLAWRESASAQIRYLPLEQVDDSSDGGRRAGVARLRLPRDARFLTAPAADDPRLAGFGDGPPEAPADLDPAALLFWLRLRCPDEPNLTLGYLGVNAVKVIGQRVVRDRMLGVGTGRPDQVLSLPDTDIEAASLRVEVEEANAFVPWRQVTHFAASTAEDRVYRLDPASGTLQFGDGIRGRRPAANAGIRAAYYRAGGGTAGNLPAGSIKELHGGSTRLTVRHEWPTKGGIDAETVAAAEQRIPAFLTHRERAVTREDFQLLARDNPVNPVARAEAVPGFLPGSNLATIRRKVPGVVSVFVLPPATPAMAAAPRPSAGLLKDVWRYLDARALLGTELYVLSPQIQPVSLALSAEASDPAAEQAVFKAIETALLEYLWALPPGGPDGTGWPLGRAVEINELRTVAGRVAGVQAVNGLRLFYQELDGGEWRELTGSQALPLLDYQLPELMTVSVQPGEDSPDPPRAYAPSDATGGVGTGAATRGIPVPVIPDLC
jgi:predicted phage baseplate assembly protein